MAKKSGKNKKKRSQGRSGEETQEARRQRLEAKRQARAEALAAQRKQRRRERIVRALTITALAGVVIWAIFLRDRAPSEMNGHEITTYSMRGVNEHTRETIQYETLPPVSGSHAPNAGPCGVHGSPIQNEVQVHMLEHGAVGVQYRPDDLEVEDIRRLESIVSDYDSFTFSAPYPEMDTPIAVSSWGRLMPLDEVDEEAVRGYADEFRDRGPEADRPCPNDVEQPYEPPEEPEGASGNENGEDGEEPSPEATP